MKKKKYIIFLVVALIILVISLLVGYFVKINNPKYVFIREIDNLFSIGENFDYTTVKTNSQIGITINGEEDSVLNGMNLTLDTEIDKDKNEEIATVKLANSEDNLLNAKMKLDGENIYVNLGELFDKTIFYSLSDLDETFDASSLADASKAINGNKAMEIFNKKIDEALKEEYFSTEKDNGVTQNKLRLSIAKLKEVSVNLCQSLADDEKFLGCFENSDAIKNDLNDIIERVDNSDSNGYFSEYIEELENKTYVELDIYTKGITKKISNVDIIIDYDEEEISVEFTKIDDENYNYSIISDNTTLASGSISYKKENNNYSIQLSVKDEQEDEENKTELVVNLSGSTLYNEPLSDFNTKNAIDYNELSEDDFNQIMENLMSNKLYEMFMEMYGLNDEFYSISDDVPNNVVKTENGKEVEFKIPDEYENSQSSRTYQEFQKTSDDEFICVKVATEESSVDEYIEKIQEIVNEYKQDEDYQNVGISDVQEIQISGDERKFKRVTMSYDSTSQDDEDEVVSNIISYIAYEIDDDNIYTIEVEGANLISDNDLAQFLMIEITETDEEDSNEEEDLSLTDLEEQEIVAFNALFEVYEGKQKGTTIKRLISYVVDSNEQYEGEREIEVVFNREKYDSISDIENEVDSSKTYEVELEYDSNEIINNIIITEI